MRRYALTLESYLNFYYIRFLMFFMGNAIRVETNLASYVRIEGHIGIEVSTLVKKALIGLTS